MASAKALLDEFAITSGEEFEEHAKTGWNRTPANAAWTCLRSSLLSRTSTSSCPGAGIGEYQLRAKIDRIEDYTLETMPIKALYLVFPFNDRPDMNLVLFVSKAVLKDYEPEVGQEIEAYAWFQGG